MRKILTSLGVAATSLTLLAGCAGMQSNVDAREGLLAADRAFSAKSVSDGMTPAFLAYAAPDATMFRGGAPVIGHEAIAKAMGTDTAGKLTWVPRKADVAASGELGYTWGEYEYRPDHSSTVLTGRYVSVWKRQGDQGWKWVVDIGNPDPPKPE